VRLEGLVKKFYHRKKKSSNSRMCVQNNWSKMEDTAHSTRYYTIEFLIKSCQEVKNDQLFCPHNQQLMVPEMVNFKQLTPVVASEDFVEFCLRENFSSLQ
jgi:hypothetical protein